MKNMKVLHVVRHAKASWDFEGTADIDRTLKSKGIRNAYTISRKLKLTNLVPDKIFTSPAIRALHTAVIFARVFEYPLPEVEICPVLYESSVDKILDMIRRTEDQYASVMIFGHNPDFTDLVNAFLKTPVDMPTSGVVTLVFNTGQWIEISKKSLEKHMIHFPDKDE
jgi:phosphohistidine phosphatase